MCPNLGHSLRLLGLLRCSQPSRGLDTPSSNDALSTLHHYRRIAYTEDLVRTSCGGRHATSTSGMRIHGLPYFCHVRRAPP